MNVLENSEFGLDKQVLNDFSIHDIFRSANVNILYCVTFVFE